MALPIVSDTGILRVKKQSLRRRPPLPVAWETRRVAAFFPSDLEALARNEIPFIHIPRYLSRDWCAEIAGRFLAAPAEVHDYGITKVRQVGLAVGPMHRDRKTYFDRANEIKAALRGIYRGGEDPLLKLQREISAWTGWKRLEALEKTRPYVSDMIGQLIPGCGIPIHCDEVEGLSVSRYPALLSWNVYLSTSDRGGKLIVYRRGFKKENNALHRGARGYDPAVVRGAEKAEFQPAQGDFVLFNAANFHEVRKTRGSSPRVSAHSYIGLDSARKRLVFWS